MKRSSLKPSRSKRDWTAAREKVEREGRCRWCGMPNAEACHIVPRSQVLPPDGEDARNIVPLCRECHEKLHDHRLDLIVALSRDEQAYVVWLVGLERARRYVTVREAA